MTDYSIFPKINATLNGWSAVLLVTGRVLIARGQRAAHRAVMFDGVWNLLPFPGFVSLLPLAATAASCISTARDGYGRSISPS